MSEDAVLSKTLLVLDSFADVYAEHLNADFPGLAVHLARKADEIRVDLATVDVLVAFGIAVNDDLFRQAVNLKWVQSLATGVDHFLRLPSFRRDILLTSGRGIHGPAMRETVVLLMMMVTRNARRLTENQDARRWDRGQPWSLLCGKTAVVVGLGVGGVAIGRLLKAFGMRVVGVSRTIRPIEGFDEIVPTDELAAAAREADYLIGILPGTSDNKERISRAVFDAMKPSAYFINVGRGETVDEAALLDVLSNNRIKGAGVDVLQNTPLRPDSPFWGLRNLVISPHIGGLFDEYERYVMPLVLRNTRRFLAGEFEQMENLIPH